jgi:nucleoside-diphosphate-sugar epimerase
LLCQSEIRVTAFSRQPPPHADEKVQWLESGNTDSIENVDETPCWICATPIWVLPDYFSLLEASGAKRVVALSSTSRFTKTDSTDPAEQAMAGRLVENEQRLQTWAETRNIEWVILRPTLIYGLGLDKNVSEIANFIKRWRFFPILGKGSGLRQPVHVEDVAQACLAAATVPIAGNRDYEVSGPEKITYREMVARVFDALGRKTRILVLPHWCFRIVLVVLKRIPRFSHWSIGMAERMDRDMVFDHNKARSELQFAPRAFQLDLKDLPK